MGTGCDATGLGHPVLSPVPPGSDTLSCPQCHRARAPNRRVPWGHVPPSCWTRIHVELGELVLWGGGCLAVLMTLAEPCLLTDPAGRPLTCTRSLGGGVSDKLQHQQSDRGTSAWGGDIGLGWGCQPGMRTPAWDGEHQHRMGTPAWDGDISLAWKSSASIPMSPPAILLANG